MGIWNSVKNAVNNFYGGNGNQDDYEDDEEQTANDSEEVDDNPSGYGSDDENPSGYGEDEAKSEEDAEGNVEAEEKEEEVRKLTFADRAKGVLMRKEAIVHGCSPRVEPVPCPVCHQKSVYKSLRTFDWFPLLIGARFLGVPLYRFYCFNNRCSKSWYRGYVFNCPTEKFTPVSAPTKRQFNAS